MKWEVLYKLPRSNTKSIVDILLRNRGIKTAKEKKEFLSPKNLQKIEIKKLGISEESINKAINRIKKAKTNKESVIVYGDYDADGITATAIMWEALHAFGLDVLPHIPDRFEEGYGINAKSIEKLASKISNLKLIITVDNGITAYEGIKKAKELGIDVIIIDHHTKGEKKNCAFSIIHSTLVSGSALAWFFSRELPDSSLISNSSSLELAAIGTIADQMPLVGINRSLVKFGLEELNYTKRPGLLSLFKEAKIEKSGVYEVGYIIAPRINAMGRLKHGIESLRLLCTKDKFKALSIAKNIGETNSERQKIVEDVLLLARKNVTNEKIIVIAGHYHEGVIGLAAGRLVEEFYRPAIVLSTKGEISKASARSINGFNIIEAIRSVNLHIGGGGHPMAAGFSIDTSKIKLFTKKINKFADKLLTDDILQKKLKIDMELDFSEINDNLVEQIKQFEPIGLGNPGAVFLTKQVEILDAKKIGREERHLKLKLKQNDQVFDSIFFGGGEMYSKLSPGLKIDLAYSIDENIWNGYKNLQLKIKDLEVLN
jgi:single-stranded-DNA-specific exonuclease